MRHWVLAGALALAPVLASAEVKFAAADGFLIEQRFKIRAPASKVWETLLHPEDWWPSDHTWSGDRANLRWSPQAGRQRSSSQDVGRCASPTRLGPPGNCNNPFTSVNKTTTSCGRLATCVFSSGNGGVDEARTRDLRRDRPAF